MVIIFRIFKPVFEVESKFTIIPISEKSTHRFGQNDGTNIQTDISFYICRRYRIGDVGIIDTNLINNKNKKE